MFTSSATIFIHEYLNQLRSSILGFSFSKFRGYSLASLEESAKGPKSSKSIIYHNSQITKHGRNGNIKQAELIFNRIPHKNTVSWTAMLTAYADNGQIDKARRVFDQMPERNIASYNAMITACVRNRCQIFEACDLFEKMKERNAITYSVMITGFVQAGMVDEAETLYLGVPVEWRDPICSNALINGYLKMRSLEGAIRIFEGMIERDVVSWSSMVDGYCKKGRIIDARRLFDNMPKRSVITWTAMIDGYIKMGYFGDGLGLFLEMRREGVDVNSTTLAILFEACGTLGTYREGIQIHGLASRIGYDSDVFSNNSLITMYCRFGCLNSATKIFHTMVKKDIVSWNSLIAGYVQSDSIEEAYELFKNFPAKDVVSWTTMISGLFSKGLINKSIKLFEQMPKKDIVAWTAIISGFVNNEECEEAVHWFIEMLRNGIRPNPLTFSIMLSASAAMATLNQGMQVHAYVMKMDMASDLSIQNSLISMYSKCGSVSEAYRIFREIKEPNVVSFNSMITGFAQNGLGQESLKLFQEMQNNGQKPNYLSFLAILSTCVHMGLVEEGLSYFKSMKFLYQIEPKPDHYACMVDLLGRSGLLDEAVDLIWSMPFKPHSGIWGALLSASKMHMRVDLAKLAAENLFELEPHNSAPYVVLSNLYSAAGEQTDMDQLRMGKKSKGIKKSPGCSWI